MLAPLPDLPPKTILDIAAHVSAGGLLIECAETLGLEQHDLSRWIMSDPDRRALYDAACLDQAELWRADVRERVRAMGRTDIRQVLDPETGRVLPPEEWPAAAAVAVREVKQSRLGDLTVKLVDPLRALELLGRDLGLFKQRVDVTLTVNIADKLKAARARARVIDAAPQGLDGMDSAQEAGGGTFDAASPSPHSLAQKIKISHNDTTLPAVPSLDTLEALVTDTAALIGELGSIEVDAAGLHDAMTAGLRPEELL